MLIQLIQTNLNTLTENNIFYFLIPTLVIQKKSHHIKFGQGKINRKHIFFFGGKQKTYFVY